MHSCDDCGKAFKYPYLLLRHLQRKTTCISVNSKVPKSNNNLQIDNKNILKCDTCEKIFKNKQAKYYHKKNVKCSPPSNEVEELKKKVLELKNELDELKNKIF